MANILSRIQEISQKEGITIGSLERMIGASKGVLSRAISNGTDIQSKWIGVLVENYPQYSTRWLLTGEGAMLRDNKISEENTMETTPNVIPISPADESIIYKMYKEKDLEVKDLMEAVGSLKEQIRQLKRENERLASDAADSIRANVG